MKQEGTRPEDRAVEVAAALRNQKNEENAAKARSVAAGNAVRDAVVDFLRLILWTMWVLIQGKYGGARGRCRCGW
jgi:hypothetical protein